MPRPVRALTRLAVLSSLALTFALLARSDAAANSRYARILRHAQGFIFDYIAWEIGAVIEKIGAVQASPAAYLPESARSAFVARYFEHVARLQTLEREIEALYGDPSPDPAARSASLRAERDALRTLVDQRTPLAEAILESQVAAVLCDEGFAVNGEVWPPVSARMTELPMLLVVSPRNVIQREFAINTLYMSADQMEALESAIDADLNVSSLVVPIGGLALYPAMVIQTWHAVFTIETVAHEWLHHYLYFFPLGLEYLTAGGETWIINETTASLFGREVGRKVVERYYADYPNIMRLLPPLTPPAPAAQSAPTTPPTFDGAKFMNDTRVQVDALLAAGKVAEAEQFMEAQRQILAQNGYRYRKLNQAYFAFYGGYQSGEGGGAGGTDPIGPAVATLRQRAGTLKAWVETMRGLTTRGALLAAAGAANP